MVKHCVRQGEQQEHWNKASYEIDALEADVRICIHVCMCACVPIDISLHVSIYLSIYARIGI
jgi:hypothetical protein